MKVVVNAAGLTDGWLFHGLLLAMVEVVELLVVAPVAGGVSLDVPPFVRVCNAVAVVAFGHDEVTVGVLALVLTGRD